MWVIVISFYDNDIDDMIYKYILFFPLKSKCFFCLNTYTMLYVVHADINFNKENRKWMIRTNFLISSDKD